MEKIEKNIYRTYHLILNNIKLQMTTEIVAVNILLSSDILQEESLASYIDDLHAIKTVSTVSHLQRSDLDGKNHSLAEMITTLNSAKKNLSKSKHHAEYESVRESTCDTNIMTGYYNPVAINHATEALTKNLGNSLTNCIPKLVMSTIKDIINTIPVLNYEIQKEANKKKDFFGYPKAYRVFIQFLLQKGENVYDSYMLFEITTTDKLDVYEYKFHTLIDRVI